MHKLVHASASNAFRAVSFAVLKTSSFSCADMLLLKQQQQHFSRKGVLCCSLIAALPKLLSVCLLCDAAACYFCKSAVVTPCSFFQSSIVQRKLVVSL
jgi:hypothetical protein